MSETVLVRGLHRSHSPCRHRWVEPVGWTPKIPGCYAGKADYSFEDAAIWDSEGEDAGLVYFGEIDEDEVGEVSLSDVGWVTTREYHYLGQAEVDSAAIPD